MATKYYDLANGFPITITFSYDEIQVVGSGTASIYGSYNKITLNGGNEAIYGNNNVIYEAGGTASIDGDGNYIQCYGDGAPNGLLINSGSNNWMQMLSSGSFRDNSGNSNTVEIRQTVGQLTFNGSVNDHIQIDAFTQDEINYAYNHRQTSYLSGHTQYNTITLGDTKIVEVGNDTYNLFNIRAKDDDSNVFLQDMTGGDKNWIHASTFTGPNVGPIALQFISSDTNSNLNITTTGSQGMFVKGSNGNDGIDMSRSTAAMNIMDGGQGSNFLTGSTAGENVFNTDARNIGSQDTWTTLLSEHSGDQSLTWGVTADDFSSMIWKDNEGADGSKGLTMHLEKNGHWTSETFKGYSTADLSNGRLGVSFGHTADTTGLPGSDYMKMDFKG